MKSKMFFSGLIIAGVFSLLAMADVQKPSAGVPGMPGIPAVDQEQMKKQQEQMKQQQQQRLEMMKKQNPQMYEQMKAAQETQDKISQITTDFHANKISYESAKIQLRPLIAEQLKPRAANVDNEIAQMEMRISQLKKFKTNFSEVVDKSVDVRLGKARPDPTMGF
jgi:uncharacterized protein involved in exopolysaccharide biosynthesis